MISGRVSTALEPYLRIEVWEESGSSCHTFDALVDTGYNGHLTLPLHVARSLRLEFLGEGRAILADGSEVVYGVYAGAVHWDGEDREIEIDAAEADVLVGMALMEGFDLSMRVAKGGDVTLQQFSGAGNPSR